MSIQQQQQALFSNPSVLVLILENLAHDITSIRSIMELNQKTRNLLGNQSAGSNAHEYVWKRLTQSRWPEMYSYVMQSCGGVATEVDSWKQVYVDRHMRDQLLRLGNARTIVLESHTCAVSVMCQADIRSNALTYVNTERPTVITGDVEGGFIQWDPQTGLQMKVAESIHSSKIVGLQYLGNNKVISCESGDSSDGEGASVVIWDAFIGQDKIYHRVDGVNALDGEFSGQVTSFLPLNQQSFACAAGSDLFIWHNNEVEESSQFFLLHHIPSAHNYQVTCLKKLEGFTGGSSDPVNDGDTGLIIISGSMDGQIKVWNADRGEIVMTLKGHSAPITDICTSLDGHIVSASNDTTIKIWDHNGQCLATLSDHTKAVTCVRVDQRVASMGVKRIVSGSADGTVRVWDSDQRGQFKCTHFLHYHASKISAIAFDDTKLVTGSTDRCINIYDMADVNMDDKHAKSIRIVNNDSHLNAISSIVLDPLGSYIFVGSADGSITEFNLVPRKKYQIKEKTQNSTGAVWVPPIYDTATNTYQGPPTPTWTTRVTNVLPPDRKPVEVIPVLPELYKDANILCNVLSPSECEALIKETETLQYEDCHGYHVQYRSNKRIIIMDQALCDVVTARIMDHVPKTVIRGGYEWECYGLNEVWRFCRYTPGQHFSAHIDGYFSRNNDDRSWFTFMIYLNGGFEAGTTRFLQDRQSMKVLYKVVPEAGRTLVFPHELLHDGEPLGTESKYIMRSDVMYKRGRRVVE